MPNLSVSSCLLLALSAGLSFSAQGADQPTRPGEPVPPDLGWPRQFSDGTATLVLHQPQVDKWPEFAKIHARSAVALTPAKGETAMYGALSMEAQTHVDLDSKSVALSAFTVTDIRFPAARDDAHAQTLPALTKNLLPAYPTSIALDRLLAYVDLSQITPRNAAVAVDPPPILVTTQPAILVILDGEPITVDIEKAQLKKVMNTNWDLFIDKNGRYYLRDDKVWLSANALDAAWSPVTKLPREFTKLPDTDQYTEIKQAVAAAQKPETPKLVLVVQKPSELIVLKGEPILAPAVDSQLMWVTNTECDLFFHEGTSSFYFLTSGRWFRSPELKSKTWIAATGSLPEDFAKIPPDHPRAHVLASVPGTRQAEEAVLRASIPQTATLERKAVKAEVQYAGEPKFEPIGDTGVSYAVNTPSDVLQVGEHYYLCLEGAWLVAATPKGPWEAADKVPEAVYRIPPNSSKHNLTYVAISESTPETVTYSYTAGYTGVYIGFGVAMWGTGYWYPPYYGWGYYPYPVYWPAAYYTYGASVWYNPATGAYARGGGVYGPYGGYGRGAAFNPLTGTYAWGQRAWGPYGAAATGGFYNPRTGTWGGGYRASNGYQSWGQSVVGRGDQWARTGSYSDSRGSVGAIKTSEGGKGVVARGSQGQGFMAKSGAGDFYAGKDGNVYKRDQAGSWYRNSGSGSWESVNRPSPTAGQRSAASEAFRNAQGRLNNSQLAAGRDAMQGLNRDAGARSWGNYNSQRYQRATSRMSGGGWASRGGGRRR
jgi:hypothetical protein